jgi:hypothetical protein
MESCLTQQRCPDRAAVDIGQVVQGRRFIETLSIFPGLTMTLTIMCSLTATKTTTPLASLLETNVKVHFDYLLVEHASMKQFYRVLCTLAGNKLDKAEATRSSFESVKTHDNPSNLTSFTKQLVNLLLGRVYRQVSNVYRVRCEQLLFTLVLRAHILPISVEGHWI